MKRVLLIALLFCLVSSVFASDLTLVPQPREISQQKGQIKLSSQWTILTTGLDQDDLYAAGLIQEEIKKDLGITISFESNIEKKKTIQLKHLNLKGDEPSLFQTQGYKIQVTKNTILIEAPTAQGRYYGAQTLRQLVRTSTKGTLPLLSITDYPSLEIRGVSDDVSRGQISTVEDFKEIIRELAYYKKNIYMPYIEDSFEFKTDPIIGRARGHITQKEMAMMQEEAKRNHIYLSPVFESLGHQDRLLSLPQNRQYAEVTAPDKAPWSFSPVNPKAFNFVTQLIDDMAEATPNPYFHIGGDESFDIGEGTSKELVDSIGIGKVHARYFNKVIDYLGKKHNRQVMLYGDMLLRHPEALEEMSRDCIIVDWHYYPQSEYTTLRVFKENGFKKVVACPAVWGFANFYPNLVFAFANISTFTEEARKYDTLGSIVSSWGDDGAENLRENNIIAYAYSAACAWEPKSPNPDEYLNRYVPVRYGIKSPNLVRAEKYLGTVNFPDTAYSARIFHLEPKINIATDTSIVLMKQFKSNMLDVQKTVAEYRGKLPYHSDHLDVMNHIAKRFIYLADAQLGLDTIARQMNFKPIASLDTATQQDIQNRLTGLRNELAEICGEYPGLWLRRNKAPGLLYHINRLTTELSQLQKFIQNCQTKDLIPSPPLKGTWMWYPETDKEMKTTMVNAWFARELNLKGQPVEAHLRFWADDNAIFFINGVKALSASYREDSFHAEVGSRLKKGSNILGISAVNNWGVAALVFELEVTYADGSKEFFTADNQWKSRADEIPGWNKTTPTGEGWLDAWLLGSGTLKGYEFLRW